MRDKMKKSSELQLKLLNLFQNNCVFFISTLLLVHLNTIFSPVLINQALFFNILFQKSNIILAALLVKCG